jgi:hypothetical protein
MPPKYESWLDLFISDLGTICVPEPHSSQSSTRSEELYSLEDVDPSLCTTWDEFTLDAILGDPEIIEFLLKQPRDHKTGNAIILDPPSTGGPMRDSENAMAIGVWDNLKDGLNKGLKAYRKTCEEREYPPLSFFGPNDSITFEYQSAPHYANADFFYVRTEGHGQDKQNFWIIPVDAKKENVFDGTGHLQPEGSKEFDEAFQCFSQVLYYMHKVNSRYGVVLNSKAIQIFRRKTNMVEGMEVEVPGALEFAPLVYLDAHGPGKLTASLALFYLGLLAGRDTKQHSETREPNWFLPSPYYDIHGKSKPLAPDIPPRRGIGAAFWQEILESQLQSMPSTSRRRKRESSSSEDDKDESYKPGGSSTKSDPKKERRKSARLDKK